MRTLDLTPTTVDLKLYVGDDPVLQLLFWTDATKTELIDLSAYTSWAARIRNPAGDLVNWTVDSSNAAVGEITLELEGEDVREFPRRGNRWDVRTVDPSGRELTLIRGRVTLTQDVAV